MNKVLYIIGIGSSIALFWYVFDNIVAVEMANAPNRSYMTICVVVYLFAFFGYAALMDLVGLIRMKSKIVKGLSIAGMSLSVLAALFAGAILYDPGYMSFDETGVYFLPYALVSFAFSIVGLVESIRSGRATPDSF